MKSNRNSLSKLFRPRPTEAKEEAKPLLHPEVGLASSVLETLREATDEEYRDALERDAARSAAAGEQGSLENSSEAARNVVTIILNPTTQSTEKIDDSDLAGTHIQESRCIHSPLESARSISQLAPPEQNFLEDIVGLPRFDALDLSKGKLLHFDAKPAASELEESVVGAPAQTRQPSLVMSLPDDKLQLNRQGVKDLKKIFKMSKDILDDTNALDEKSARNEASSNKIPDFGINSKISDLNERIDQLNTLTKLSKIPKLNIDGKYSKVAKGAEILEDSEEISNVDCLQAGSARELTEDPTVGKEKSNVPDVRALADLNEGVLKTVPDLVTKAKNLLKLKDVQLIPSKVVNGNTKSSEANVPNLKLLTIEEIISRAKAINLKDLIPGATVAPTTLRPVLDPIINGASDFNDRGVTMNSENNTLKFETEIIDAIPSPSENHGNIAQSNSEETTPALTTAAGSLPILSEQTSNESQTETRDDEEIISTECKEGMDNEEELTQFSRKLDEGSERISRSSSESAVKSLDGDEDCSAMQASKPDLISEGESKLRSKSNNIINPTAKESVDSASQVSETNVLPLKKSIKPSDDSRIPRPSDDRLAALSPIEQNGQNSVRNSETILEELPTGPTAEEQLNTAENVVSDTILNDAGKTCIANTVDNDGKKASKIPEADRKPVFSDNNPFKRKVTTPSIILNKPNLLSRIKANKSETDKTTDMTVAASERHSFIGNNLFSQKSPKQSIFRTQPNLQASGPWPLFSGLEQDSISRHAQIAPEKIRDLFEGLSRTTGNDGISGIAGPIFPETRFRLKSPFLQQNEPLRPTPLSGLSLDNLAPSLPNLDEIRERAQDLFSSQKFRDSGIPSLGNLNVNEPLKHLDDLKDRVQKNAASAVNNLQQTLSSTLDVAKVRSDNLLGNALYAQPESVLDTLSKARFDVDDRLQSIHSNVMDRLSSINEQIASIDPAPLSLPRVGSLGKDILKSARLQEKSASENRFTITSPKTPTARLRSGQKTTKPKSQSRISGPSTNSITREPIQLSPLPEIDLSKLSLPWKSDIQLGSRKNDKLLKAPTPATRKPAETDNSDEDIQPKPLPIVRKTLKKPAEKSREGTSRTPQRKTIGTSNLRVKPLHPTPAIGRKQIRKPPKSSPETTKWKMALGTTASPRRFFTASSTTRPLLRSSHSEDERASPLSKLSFDPKERLRASLKSQRDSLGASSHDIKTKTDSLNERLKNSLALHRQKAKESAKSRPTLLKPVVKVNISKMELPERTAFKEPGKLQKRDSETEEDEAGLPESLLKVKPLEKVPNVNELLDKLRESVRTSISTATLKPTLLDKEAGKLQLKPDLMAGASETFKSMVEKANQPMKENMTYQCKMVCNKE